MKNKQYEQNVEQQDTQESEVYFYTNKYNHVYSGTVTSFKQVGSKKLVLIATPEGIACIDEEQVYLDYNAAKNAMDSKRKATIASKVGVITNTDELLKWVFSVTVNKSSWSLEDIKVLLVSTMNLGFNWKEHNGFADSNTNII